MFQNKVLNILLFVVVYELILMNMLRKLNRRRTYRLAKQRSVETGKPLMVIGAPGEGLANRITGQDYDCGDICLDIAGCKKCNNGVKISLEEAVERYDLSKYVVFISCTLEYVDMPFVDKYLRALNPLDLFVVNIGKHTLSAYIYPGFLTGEPPTKYVVTKSPPHSLEIRYFRNPMVPYYKMIWTGICIYLVYLLTSLRK